MTRAEQATDEPSEEEVRLDKKLPIDSLSSSSRSRIFVCTSSKGEKGRA